MTRQIAPPKDWDQWHCRAYDSRSGKHFKGEVWVRAKTRAGAEKVAQVALHGLGRIRVYASPYYPWRDPAFAGRWGVSTDGA